MSAKAPATAPTAMPAMAALLRELEDWAAAVVAAALGELLPVVAMVEVLVKFVVSKVVLSWVELKTGLRELLLVSRCSAHSVVGGTCFCE